MDRYEERAFLELKTQLSSVLETGRELSDEEIYMQIDLLLQRPQTGYLPLSVRIQLRERLFNAVRRLDVLQELLDDPENTEIMINETRIFREREGRLTEWDKRLPSRERTEDLVQQIVAGCNRVANESQAIVDARLPGGARVNIVMRPVAPDGPIITIRRFPDMPISMQQLIRLGSLSEEAAKELARCVRSGFNIFISGGTGSGKTTFLNALSQYIPKEERIIITNKILGRIDIVNTGRCTGDGMDITAPGIHARVNLHTEIPLVSFFGLVHFLIALPGLILRGTGSRNDRSINDSSAMHHEASLFKSVVDISKDPFTDLMLLKQMAELQKGGSIRNLFNKEINVHEASHGIAVIYGIFDAFIRQIEPVLKQVHAQHCLYSSRRTATLAGRVIFPDHFNPMVPGNDLIHGMKEFFLLSSTFPIGVFDIAEGLLFHMTVPPFMMSTLYQI